MRPLSPRRPSLVRWTAALRSRYAFPARWRREPVAGLRAWVWLRPCRWFERSLQGPTVHHWQETRSILTAPERVREIVERVLPTRPPSSAGPMSSSTRPLATPPAAATGSTELRLQTERGMLRAPAPAPGKPEASLRRRREDRTDPARQVVVLQASPARPRHSSRPPLRSATPRPAREVVSHARLLQLPAPSSPLAAAPPPLRLAPSAVPTSLERGSQDRPARASSELLREHAIRAAGRTPASTAKAAPAGSVRTSAATAAPLVPVERPWPLRPRLSAPSRPGIASASAAASRSATPPAPPWPPLVRPEALAPLRPATAAAHVVHETRGTARAALRVESAPFEQGPAARHPPLVVRPRRPGDLEYVRASAPAGSAVPDAESIRRQVEESVERTVVERVVQRVEKLVARELSPESAPVQRISERVSAELSEALVLERERLGWS